MSVADCTRNPEVEYRDIPGFPGYQVGDDGSVWTAWCGRRKPRIGDTWIRKGELVHRGKRSDSDSQRCPYHHVILTISRRRYNRYVHRLVLEVFRGPCPPGCETRHLDGNHENNRLSNLIWGTKQRNWDDKRVHGTATIGERSGKTTLTEDDVRHIRQLRAEGHSGKFIARQFGISVQGVYGITNRRNWKHVE